MHSFLSSFRCTLCRNLPSSVPNLELENTSFVWQLSWNSFVFSQTNRKCMRPWLIDSKFLLDLFEKNVYQTSITNNCKLCRYHFCIATYASYSLSFSKYFQWFCCSCLFITINSGSIIFYLFIYCLSCLNINRVCKTFLFLFLYNCFSSFHLFDSLARSSC